MIAELDQALHDSGAWEACRTALEPAVVRCELSAVPSFPAPMIGIRATPEQVGELPLLRGREAREHRGLGERGDQTLTNLHAGRGERQRLDAPVRPDASARDQPPTLQPVNQECHVGRIAVQALGDLTPRHRPELRIELPDDVGQWDCQVQLDQRVVKLVLERGVHGVRGLGELVPNP